MATFPFPALAALAARAPLGGAREVVMACFVSARLVRDATGPDAIPPSLRATRASGARAWLATLAVPVAQRAPFAKLIEASATDDPAAMRAALAVVMAVTAIYIDSGARSELEHLAQALTG
jgi:hypothetical protein